MLGHRSWVLVSTAIALGGHLGAAERLGARMATHPISVNGDLSDWDTASATLSFSGSAARGDRTNRCRAIVTWSAEKLFVAFEVRDTELHAAHVEDSATVYGDDGVELFLDRGFDHGPRMGTDDYHVLVSIGGSVAVARGSQEKLREGAVVPQVFGYPADVLRFVRLDGTVNDVREDVGYVVELALSWADFGGIPRSGETIGMAFCVDDRDGPGHPDTLPAALYEPFSHDGVTDFGYPRDWRPVTFEGAVPLAARMRAQATPAAVAALLGAALLVLVASGVRLRLRTSRALRELREDAARDATRAMEKERVLQREVELALQAAEAAALLEESLPTPPAAPAPLLPASSEPTAADRIVRHLEEHHADDLTMEGVARALGFSVKTMERLLRKRGTSYVAILTEIRMTRARELLLHTERSITEIAFDVGFSDSSYFTKVFRKRFGLTPTLMRREYAAAMRAPAAPAKELAPGAEA